MNLLHRYIFRNLLAAACLAVGVFAFVLITGNVLRDVLGLVTDGRLSMPLFLRLLGLLVPYVIAYALPLGILTAVLLVLGRLSSQQEITAMRAAGMSLFRISAPIFFLAILGLAFSITVNFYYAPNARSQYREDLSLSIRENPLNYIVEKQFVRDFPGYVIYVGEKHENELRDLWLWELDDNRMVSRFIHANEGRVDFEQETESIRLALEGGIRADIRSESDPENLMESRPLGDVERTAVRLPLGEILGRGDRSKRYSDMTFNEILRERDVALSANNGEADFQMLIEIQLSIQERFSMAFSVLSLAILAVPLGIKIQRKETSSNLVIALCLAMVFYFMIMSVGWFETRPRLRPDLLVWIPNLLFQAAGIWLFLRMEKL